MNNPKIISLQNRKEEIEREIAEHGETLREQGNVGMSGNLIDSEGYPRNDIDIYKIRLARQRINMLQNDYKQLLIELEEELSDYHAKFKNVALMEHNQMIKSQPSFLRITQIDEGSPAQEAGLLLNDEIIQFGPFVESTIDKKLLKIAELVKTSENKIILLNVSRSKSEPSTRDHVKIKLVPKKWSGHGLLGCKIVPIERQD